MTTPLTEEKIFIQGYNDIQLETRIVQGTGQFARHALIFCKRFD